MSEPEHIRPIVKRVVKRLKLTAPKRKEYHDQRYIMEWARLNEGRYPALKLLHASMNGAAMKSPKQAMTAKLAGMKNGVPDLEMPHPRCNLDIWQPDYHGFYMEVKTKDQINAKNGGLSDDQIWWINTLNNLSYYAVVCYGGQDGVETLKWYLNILR